MTRTIRPSPCPPPVSRPSAMSLMRRRFPAHQRRALPPPSRPRARWTSAPAAPAFPSSMPTRATCPTTSTLLNAIPRGSPGGSAGISRPFPRHRRPDEAGQRAAAFLAAPGQGINLHRGTWHGCPHTAGGGLFAVVDRVGEANLEEYRYSAPWPRDRMIPRAARRRGAGRHGRRFSERIPGGDAKTARKRTAPRRIVMSDEAIRWTRSCRSPSSSRLACSAHSWSPMPVAIAVPLIIGRVLKLEPQDVAFLISADLFVCGIDVTLLQLAGARPSGSASSFR